MLVGYSYRLQCHVDVISGENNILYTRFVYNIRKVIRPLSFYANLNISESVLNQ